MELFNYEKDHLARVRDGLAECMVLLKKDGAFPLDKPTTLAAYGNGIRYSVKGGTGSGEVNSRFYVNFEQGLEGAGFSLSNKAWLDAYDEKRAEAKKQFKKQIKKDAKALGTSPLVYAMGCIMPEPEYTIPLSYEGDAAIYVVSRISGEGNDRKAKEGDLFLSKTEVRDILELNKRFDKFMLVINTGGPVDLTPVLEVKNILVISQLGVEMGNALADVLLGKANPSGKLTTTWSAWEDYCPDIDFGDVENTYYNEGVYVGYRYFDTVGKKALFPFGYGLSLSEFEILGAECQVDGTRVRVEAEVKNVGNLSGKEVVQVYVTPPEKKIKKPFQSLAGFGKTEELAKDRQGKVEISFDLSELASFDEEKCAMVLESGEYIVRVGNSSVNTKPVAKLVLDEDVLVQQLRLLIGKETLDEKIYERVNRGEDLANVRVIYVSAKDFATEDVAYDREIEVNEAVKKLTDEELVYLQIGAFKRRKGINSIVGTNGVNVVGAAGETTSALLDKGIKPIIMADGPAGLRLAREYFADKNGNLKSVGNSSVPESILDLLSGPVKLIAKIALENKPPKNAKIETQYCTAIPIGTAIAQSWNLDYAKTCGDVVGAEMEKFGVHLWLAPALNIHRSILCGRNFEYFSEDPLISGKFAAALTNGVQAHKGCGTTIKHFAANNQETNRYFNNSIMSERALREIYLRGFGICVREAQPEAIMTSYNLINGLHTAENRGLSEDYLRAENGYKGIIMTDWVIAMFPSLGGQYRNSLAHEVAKAGGDVFMPGCEADYENVLGALKDGSLSRHQLELNGTRIYEMSKKLVK